VTQTSARLRQVPPTPLIHAMSTMVIVLGMIMMIIA
jgi:hypothetical protein